jgi:hypothetical protein
VRTVKQKTVTAAAISTARALSLPASTSVRKLTNAVSDPSENNGRLAREWKVRKLMAAPAAVHKAAETPAKVSA